MQYNIKNSILNLSDAPSSHISAQLKSFITSMYYECMFLSTTLRSAAASVWFWNGLHV